MTSIPSATILPSIVIAVVVPTMMVGHDSPLWSRTGLQASHAERGRATQKKSNQMATEVQQMHSHLLSCVVPFALKNVKKTKFYHFQKSQRAGVSRTYNHLYVNFYLLPLTRTISGYNPASGYKLFITSTAVITPKPFGLLIYKSSSPFITIAWPVITISYICPSHKTIKVADMQFNISSVQHLWFVNSWTALLLVLKVLTQLMFQNFWTLLNFKSGFFGFCGLGNSARFPPNSARFPPNSARAKIEKIAKKSTSLIFWGFQILRNANLSSRMSDFWRPQIVTHEPVAKSTWLRIVRQFLL